MQTSTNKCQMVMEAVRRRIEEGDFRVGDRIPSDSEFVREFGVSRPTVAKALQELERAGWVRRRAGSGTFVQEIRRKEAQQFGLLIPGFGKTEIFEPICAEMARAARASGHVLLWDPGSSRRMTSETEALDLCQQYIASRVGGVFFAPIEHATEKDEFNGQIMASFDEFKIPVVLIDRDFVPYPQRSRHDLVGVDNRRVGYTVTRHLFERGCERVVFVGAPGAAVTMEARIAGFIEAVAKDAGVFDASLVRRVNPHDREAVGQMISELRPDGVVCSNDTTAGHLMNRLDELGLDVPDDVLVAGVDDVKYAEVLRAPLTTMRQPCAAIGAAAVRTMMERLEFPAAPPRDVLLGCELVVRASTTPVRLSERQP